MGRTGPSVHNPTRPPDVQTPGILYTPVSTHSTSVDTRMVDVDEYMDAHDQRSNYGDDSEMEVVIETPISDDM